MNFKHKETQARSGFTLIELLMVVALIALLTSMSLVVMNGIAEQAQVEATKMTVLKISRLLDDRLEAFERSFDGPQRDSYVSATVDLLKDVDGRFDYFKQNPDEAPPAIKLLAYKAASRFEFPQRIVELNVGGGAVAPATGLTAAVTDPDTGLPFKLYLKFARPTARQQLIAKGNANPSIAEINTRVSENWATHQAYEAEAHSSDQDDLHSTESSELLYYMLTQAGSFGSSQSVADEFIAAEIDDTDGDGFPEFIDAWGQPLQFYRWPTRMIDPTAPNPFVPVFSDPADPTEVDPTPDNDESDGLREIMQSERDYAGLMFKGMPPSPTKVTRTLPAVTGTSTQRDMLLVDPDDPVGILYSFIEDPKYKSMGIDLTQEYNEAMYHTPDTFHAPLIVSAGADELLGIREPNNTNAAMGIFGNLAQYAGTTTTSPLPSERVFDALQDNITNRNRRAGARR